MNEIPKARILLAKAHTYITNQLMPVEAVVSMPVPLVREGKLASGHFVAMLEPLQDRSNSSVYPPAYHVFLDWQGEEVLAHQQLSTPDAQEVAAPLGLYLAAEFAGEWTDEKDALYMTVLQDLYEAVEVLGPDYQQGAASAGTQMQQRRYLSALNRLHTPEVIGMYRDLNPSFFGWLEGQAASATGMQPASAQPVTAPAAPAVAPNTTPASAPTRFCRECGQPRGSTQFCTNCGTRYPD